MNTIELTEKQLTALRIAIAEGQQLFREWCGNSYEWDALTDLERQRWNRLASRRPTPAIQQAVEALESAAHEIALWRKETDDARTSAGGEPAYGGEYGAGMDNKKVTAALTALRHLNGEVRG